MEASGGDMDSLRGTVTHRPQLVFLSFFSISLFLWTPIQSLILPSDRQEQAYS